jgi:SAM-dependent methyltransferase
MAREPDYWDSVGAAWNAQQPHRVWREFTDRHQLSLIDRWLAPSSAEGCGRSGRPAAAVLLKTDLFDEVAGNGIAAYLAATGVRVTGIDISPVIVAAAATRNPGIEAIVADVRGLPFPDASFDMVFSGSTLDHFHSAADIRTALSELRRVLRPGGHMVLTMDNPANPIIWLRNGSLLRVLRHVGIVPYQVGVTLAPRALAAAVHEAGFDISEFTAVMHCPRAIAVMLAGLADRFGRSCRESFVHGLWACERLESLPTRWLTGHYIAIHAVARHGHEQRQN